MQAVQLSFLAPSYTCTDPLDGYSASQYQELLTAEQGVIGLILGSGPMGYSLNLEILSGGGLKQFWKSRCMGGSKNRAFRRGCVDFFWNNPILRNEDAAFALQMLHLCVAQMTI